MTVLRSELDPEGSDFRANASAMRRLIERLRADLATAAVGGPEEARQKHLARGKLLPRARVEALLDPGTRFLELSPLAAWGMYGGDVPAASIITGVGRVSGVECVSAP